MDAAGMFSVEGCQGLLCVIHSHLEMGKASRCLGGSLPKASSPHLATSNRIDTV